ncbi:MAG: hypothetical protein ACTSSH_13365, partial [Candidatus Heimdallarchaeota archaeon]
LKVIMKDMSKIDIYSGMTLENFSLKHDDLINNISLDSVAEQREKAEAELICKICNGKIVWRQKDYNDMLGFNVLKIRCLNGHEDTIIGFADEEEEEEVIEIKCAKCDSETLIPTKIDLFSKDALAVVAACPKNHETEFIIKKK